MKFAVKKVAKYKCALQRLFVAGVGPVVKGRIVPPADGANMRGKDEERGECPDYVYTLVLRKPVRESCRKVCTACRVSSVLLTRGLFMTLFSQDKNFVRKLCRMGPNGIHGTLLAYAIHELLVDNQLEIKQTNGHTTSLDTVPASLVEVFRIALQDQDSSQLTVRGAFRLGSDAACGIWEDLNQKGDRESMFEDVKFDDEDE